jgi:hypothetical protein
VTDGSGNYTISGLADGSYTVTPSLAGYTFAPATASATVSVDASHSAITDASGNYTISGLADGSYTVTPSLSGYTFAPATASATVAGADVTGINFTSTTSGGGGGITAPTDIAGCVLWLDGADPKNNGNPAAGALDSWTNKADPTLSPYQPDPNNQPSVVLNGLNGLSIMEFTGGGQTYDIVDTSLTKTKLSAQTYFWVLKEDNIN